MALLPAFADTSKNRAAIKQLKSMVILGIRALVVLAT
jgi:hypothetical protein